MSADKYVIESLANGCVVLRFFMEHLAPWQYYSISELDARLPDLSSQQLFRICKTLQAAGFLEADKEGRKYKIGHDLLFLSHKYLNTLRREHDRLRAEVNQFSF